VLRRILRRAVRYGRQNLNVADPFMHRLVPVVVELVAGVGLDGADAVLGERAEEFAFDQFDAFEDARGGGLLGVVPEGEIEVIDDGKDALDDAGGALFSCAGLIGDGAALVVLEVGQGALVAVLGLGQLGAQGVGVGLGGVFAGRVALVLGALVGVLGLSAFVVTRVVSVSLAGHG